MDVYCIAALRAAHMLLIVGMYMYMYIHIQDSKTLAT